MLIHGGQNISFRSSYINYSLHVAAIASETMRCVVHSEDDRRHVHGRRRAHDNYGVQGLGSLSGAYRGRHQMPKHAAMDYIDGSPSMKGGIALPHTMRLTVNSPWALRSASTLNYLQRPERFGAQVNILSIDGKVTHRQSGIGDVRRHGARSSEARNGTSALTLSATKTAPARKYSFGNSLEVDFYEVLQRWLL